MARRVASIGATRPWIVLEDEDDMIGYAYASPHNERPAYRWSVSTAIYVGRGYHRCGAGRALYTTLFALLRALGYRQATAGITLPNPPSVGLHSAFGFAPAGVYRDIGYKMGGWHDVGWYQAEIQPASTRPADPLPVGELADTSVWHHAVNLGLDAYAARNENRRTKSE
jgi:phosphinothricin acetyltransferase